MPHASYILLEYHQQNWIVTEQEAMFPLDFVVSSLRDQKQKQKSTWWTEVVLTVVSNKETLSLLLILDKDPLMIHCGYQEQLYA